MISDSCSISYNNWQWLSGWHNSGTPLYGTKSWRSWQFSWPNLTETSCNTRKCFGGLPRVFFDWDEIWNFETKAELELNYTLRLEIALHVASRWRFSMFPVTRSKGKKRKAKIVVELSLLGSKDTVQSCWRSASILHVKKNGRKWHNSRGVEEEERDISGLWLANVGTVR